MTPQEREARLRAARRLQDDIYQGIGATDRPDVDGRGPTSAAGGRMRDEARDSATSMTRAGTQPLRDLLAQPDDRRHPMDLYCIGGGTHIPTPLENHMDGTRKISRSIPADAKHRQLCESEITV